VKIASQRRVRLSVGMENIREKGAPLKAKLPNHSIPLGVENCGKKAQKGWPGENGNDLVK
jgi:hypothetical protein